VIINTGHPSRVIRENVQKTGLSPVEKPLVNELLSTIEAIGPLH